MGKREENGERSQQGGKGPGRQAQATAAHQLKVLAGQRHSQCHEQLPVWEFPRIQCI